MSSHVRLIGAALSAAAFAFAAPALAQDDTPPASFITGGGDAPAAAPATADDGPPAWYVTCETPGTADTCVSQVALALPDTNQRLLTAMVQSNLNGGESLILQLPHGILFQTGVQVAVDGGQAQQLMLSTSDVTGVYAGAALTEALIAEMRAGQALSVIFRSVEGETFDIPAPLDGFSAALDLRRQGAATE